jgi:hypothetical protein
MAVQFRLDATGNMGVGGGSPAGLNLGGNFAVGTPAFYTLALIVALLIVILAVAHSLR